MNQTVEDALPPLAMLLAAAICFVGMFLLSGCDFNPGGLDFAVETAVDPDVVPADPCGGCPAGQLCVAPDTGGVLCATVCDAPEQCRSGCCYDVTGSVHDPVSVCAPKDFCGL